MTRLKVIFLLILISILLSGSTPIGRPEEGFYQRCESDILRQWITYIPFVTNAEQLELGTATHDSFLLDQNYANTTAEHFDILVPEVAGNYGYVVENGWGNMDTIMSFAETHGMEVYYHTVFWHWYPAQPPDPMAWLHEAMTRYPQIIHWIVVNEGYDYYGNPILPYIDEAFIEARVVRPDATLWYNGILRTDAEQVQAKRLVKLGLADAIGIQMHLIPSDDLSVYDGLLTWLRDNGMKWAVTELDVSIPAYTDEYLRIQAEVYADVVALVHQYNGAWITMWEFTDKYNWLQQWGAPFNSVYLPKPAWEVLQPTVE